MSEEFRGCGCKICRAGLGEAVNDLILAGRSLKFAQNFLKNEGLEVSLKLIKKHLFAFDLYGDTNKTEVLEPEVKPNTVNLNEIDFIQYDIDLENIESIIDFIQKVNLKILFNQQQIVLQQQQDKIDGNNFEKDTTEFRNLAIAYNLLEASGGLRQFITLSQSVKALEAEGYQIQSKFSANN